MNKSNVFFALVITAATLGFSSQAFAVTRTCPVKGEVSGGDNIIVQGVPGSARTVFLARKKSQGLTENVLNSELGIQNYFGPYIKAGTEVKVTAYTYNNNASGCFMLSRYTRTVFGTKQ